MPLPAALAARLAKRGLLKKAQPENGRQLIHDYFGYNAELRNG